MLYTEGKAELANCAKTLIKSIWELKNPKLLENALAHLQFRFEYEWLSRVVVLLARHFDDHLRDNVVLLKLIVQSCKYSQISCLEHYIQCLNIRLIERMLLILIKQYSSFLFSH